MIQLEQLSLTAKLLFDLAFYKGEYMSEECTHNHHHHHHHHHDCGHHHYDYSHKCADCCDDQLPNVSKVGRGLAGDSFKIDCYDDEKDENLTYLIGKKFDSVTKE